jgi:hypothetical protein
MQNPDIVKLRKKVGELEKAYDDLRKVVKEYIDATGETLDAILKKAKPSEDYPMSAEVRVLFDKVKGRRK